MANKATGQSVNIKREVDGVQLNMDDLGNIGIINEGGLVPDAYDYIGLTYSGDNITQAVYKSGGASGTLVATLDMTYSGDNITTVTRS